MNDLKDIPIKSQVTTPVLVYEIVGGGLNGLVYTQIALTPKLIHDPQEMGRVIPFAMAVAMGDGFLTVRPVWKQDPDLARQIGAPDDWSNYAVSAFFNLKAVFQKRADVSQLKFHLPADRLTADAVARIKQNPAGAVWEKRKASKWNGCRRVSSANSYRSRKSSFPK